MRFDAHERLQLLRITTAVGLLAGFAYGYELWFPIARTFPRAPLLFDAPVWLERLLGTLLFASVAASIFSARRVFFIAALVTLAALAFFDQTRLQPWVYQYSLILAVLTLAGPTGDDQTRGPWLGLVQVLIAGIYVWSGVQKMNYTFLHETLPLVLAPLSGIFPSLASPPASVGIAVAAAEALIGLGLLWRRTRSLAMIAAVSMHVVILILLVARDYNRVVWFWNATLVGLVIVAFWRSHVSWFSALQHAKRVHERVAVTLVLAVVLLPFLSFVGWWDAYLSGALYSGNVEVGVVHIDPSLADDLPDTARSVIFQTKTTGETMLPLFEWSIADLGAPLYPESRVFRSVFRDMCRTSIGAYKAELIIRERPAIFDGTYRITHSDCRQFNLK